MGNINAPSLLLVGELVTLETFKHSDITAEYISWLKDEEVVRYSSQRFKSHTVQTCKDYLETFEHGPNLFLSVRLRSSGLMVGTVTAFVALPHGTADIGLLIGNREYWGKGIGLDVWLTFMGWLFKNYSIRKVTGGTLRGNVGMIQVMKRAGMQLEAIRFKQQIMDGEEQDELYFAKFRD